MCYIKYGKDIETREDVRNLITGLVLRQRSEYDKTHIINQVNKYMSGSRYTMTPRELDRMVADSLDIFRRNHVIRCWTGKYRTKSAVSLTA